MRYLLAWGVTELLPMAGHCRVSCRGPERPHGNIATDAQAPPWAVTCWDISRTAMEIYLNDSANSFEFVIKGDLADAAVRSLELSWLTATSILGGKDVSVEVSGLTAADEAGVELLYRMTASGARLRAALPPDSEGLLRSLGIPVAALARREKATLFVSLGRLFGLSG